MEKIIEEGNSLAIFIRCFVDKKGIEQELQKMLYREFPRGVLATISGMRTYDYILAIREENQSMELLSDSDFSSGINIDFDSVFFSVFQLILDHFLFMVHGMRTYDYILAMREENQSVELLSNSDFSSSDNTDFVSPEKPTLVIRFSCKGRGGNENPKSLSIRVESDPDLSSTTKRQGFHVNINPWNLIKVSRVKAFMSAETRLPCKH